MAGRRAPSRPAPSPSTGGGNIAIPHLVTDPVWSLKPWPVTVDLQGRELSFPAMCAADWLQVLMSRDLDPDDVVPGMLDEDDYTFVEDQLHHGHLDWEQVQHLSLQVIGTVSGRPWWVTLRLIATARDNWDSLGGELVTDADASTLSLSAWLDVLFLLIVRNIADDKRTMFLLKLEMAPPGFEPAPEELEMPQDAFLAMAGE